MRIISPFHDYYDSAMSLGQDQTRVFERKTVQYEKTKVRHTERIPDLVSEGAPWHYETCAKYVLYFCGKVYPFYSRAIATPKNPLYVAPHVFSFEKAFKTQDKLNPNPLKVTQSWEKHKKTTNDWEQWITDQTGSDCSEFNIKMNCPIILLTWDSKFKWRLIKNPCMQDYNLQRLIDPYTAFQELSMFVGGVMANNFDPPEAMTDKQKVNAHGFDPKYGFRKMPAK
jgi:hypothetical protein